MKPKNGVQMRTDKAFILFLIIFLALGNGNLRAENRLISFRQFSSIFLLASGAGAMLTVPVVSGNRLYFLASQKKIDFSVENHRIRVKPNSVEAIERVFDKIAAKGSRDVKIGVRYHLNMRADGKAVIPVERSPQIALWTRAYYGGSRFLAQRTADFIETNVPRGNLGVVYKQGDPSIILSIAKKNAFRHNFVKVGAMLTGMAALIAGFGLGRN